MSNEAYDLLNGVHKTRLDPKLNLCLTNNATERALLGIAIGRKNWPFAGSDRGAEWAVAIYTLIATARLNNIDPQAY